MRVKRWCIGWKSTNNYGGHEITGCLYKLSVGAWILLGLASCASVITTLQDAYMAIVWRVHETAVKLKERPKIAGFPDPQQSSTQSKHGVNVALADSDWQAVGAGEFVDNCCNERISSRPIGRYLLYKWYFCVFFSATGYKKNSMVSTELFVLCRL